MILLSFRTAREADRSGIWKFWREIPGSRWRAPRNDAGGWVSSRGLRVLAEPGEHARVGVGVLGDVADHGDRVGAGGKNLGGVFELDAADCNQWNGADALFPLGDFCNALRREAHRFQPGRKYRAQRD